VRLVAVALLCVACPNERAAYNRGLDQGRKDAERLERLLSDTCEDGGTYPSTDWEGPAMLPTHVCVHGFWVAIAGQRRSDLPPLPCEWPYCVSFGKDGEPRNRKAKP